jgi:hypothetical protein
MLRTMESSFGSLFSRSLPRFSLVPVLQMPSVAAHRASSIWIVPHEVAST